MKCRTIKNGNVIWFGSYGKNPDGTAKFDNDKKESYSDKQQGLVSRLTQKLSVIKTELWYRMSYGLPLYDKLNSKVYLDAVVVSIISNEDDVVSIESFKSTVDNHKYHCDAKINSIYGDIYFRY